MSTHQSPLQRPSDELAYVIRCLTERDLQIVEAVGRFGVFTAEHIADMFFDSVKRAQVRLQRLHALRVLDRFQPYRAGWGSSPFHYILGPNGAEVLAADADCGQARKRTARGTLALRRRRELDRVVLVNGFYARLVCDARRRQNAELQDWLNAEEVVAWSDGIVRGDAFGRWTENGHGTDFFLEIDRGGTWISGAGADLERYQRFTHERGAAAWVLFVLTSINREAAIHATLRADVPVATSTAVGLSGLRSRWLPLGGNRGASLPELPELPALPSPPDGRRSWRYRRPWSASEDDTADFIARGP